MIELLYQCFKHFYHLDCINAPLHMATVKYSPITFRLAEAIEALLLDNGQPRPSNSIYPDVFTVLLDKGAYAEDRGR